MIELSNETVEAVAASKEQKEARLLDRALDELQHINELKRSSDFQWFLSLILEEVRDLEERVLTPRLVRDDEMPTERQKLVEWRKFLTLLERKEQEARSILGRNSRHSKKEK